MLKINDIQYCSLTFDFYVSREYVKINRPFACFFLHLSRACEVNEKISRGPFFWHRPSRADNLDEVVRGSTHQAKRRTQTITAGLLKTSLTTLQKARGVRGDFERLTLNLNDFFKEVNSYFLNSSSKKYIENKIRVNHA